MNICVVGIALSWIEEPNSKTLVRPPKLSHAPSGLSSLVPKISLKKYMNTIFTNYDWFHSIAFEGKSKLKSYICIVCVLWIFSNKLSKNIWIPIHYTVEGLTGSLGSGGDLVLKEVLLVVGFPSTTNGWPARYVLQIRWPLTTHTHTRKGSVHSKLHRPL